MSLLPRGLSSRLYFRHVLCLSPAPPVTPHVRYVALFYIGFIKAGRINILGLEGGEYCHDLSRFDVGVDQLLAEGHGVDMHCMDEVRSRSKLDLSPSTR